MEGAAHSHRPQSIRTNLQALTERSLSPQPSPVVPVTVTGQTAKEPSSSGPRRCHWAEKRTWITAGLRWSSQTPGLRAFAPKAESLVTTGNLNCVYVCMHVCVHACVYACGCMCVFSYSGRRAIIMEKNIVDRDHSVGTFKGVCL